MNQLCQLKPVRGPACLPRPLRSSSSTKETLVALVEGSDPRMRESRCVHKHVVTAVLRLNEPKALAGVVEFHSAGNSHHDLLSRNACGEPILRRHASARKLLCGERQTSRWRARLIPRRGRGPLWIAPAQGTSIPLSCGLSNRFRNRISGDAQVLAAAIKP
jgi:hypothetical protein